jgi:hypothetical protein
MKYYSATHAVLIIFIIMISTEVDCEKQMAGEKPAVAAQLQVKGFEYYAKCAYLVAMGFVAIQYFAFAVFVGLFINDTAWDIFFKFFGISSFVNFAGFACAMVGIANVKGMILLFTMLRGRVPVTKSVVALEMIRVAYCGLVLLFAAFSWSLCLDFENFVNMLLGWYWVVSTGHLLVAFPHQFVPFYSFWNPQN